MVEERILPAIKEKSSETRNVLITLLLIILLYITSIFFYHKIEGWEYLDAAYFITMTITTIGYGDLVPKTEMGKFFTMFLAFIGISLAFLLIASIASLRERAIDRQMVDKLMLLKRLSVLHRRDEKPGLKTQIPKPNKKK